jgi:putative SOS response-associated peptidase YedK
MCGRYRLSRRTEVLAEYFGADSSDVDWEPRYNIAPTQAVPVPGRPEHALRPFRKMQRRFAVWIIRARQASEARPPEYGATHNNEGTRYRLHSPH